jgi:hypothetical protein
MSRPKAAAKRRHRKPHKTDHAPTPINRANPKKSKGPKTPAKTTMSRRHRNESIPLKSRGRKSSYKVVELGFEGGVVALAGYVNQMLGSAADFAICLSRKTDEAGGFKTLISFETEKHGEDSCLTGLTEEKLKIRVLKQYKFSANPAVYPIRQKELNTIVATLKRNANKANKTEKLLTHLVLCTNRPVASKVQGSPSYKAIRHEPYEPARAFAALESYAARFGLRNPDELHQGVSRVTKYLFEAATSPSHRLTEELFKENLIGHKHAHSLVLAEAVMKRRDELRDLGDNGLRLVAASLADREIVRTATRDWLYDAIVVFVGDGGCGKTTAIWQLLWEAVDAQPPQALAYLMISNGQSLQSFGAIVEHWRGTTTAADTVSDELAMARLTHANTGGPTPIVLLGLDGIDETHVSPMWHNTAARILSFFWGIHLSAKTNSVVAPARLFVSCRSESDFDKLLPNPTGKTGGGVKPKYVRFGEFTTRELADLVRNTPRVDRRAAKRILESLAGEVDLGEMRLGPQALDVPSIYLELSTLELLKHPIIWRSFTSLDADAQFGVLESSPDAQDKLGSAFLEWFCDRVHHRLGIEPDYVPVALRGVVSYCPDLAATQYVDSWVQAVREATAYSDEYAMGLYKEGVSSGLVQDIRPAGGDKSPRRSWRWKHMFLAAYLKRSSE